MNKFSASPGTRDILPPQAARWRLFQTLFAEVVESAGYGYTVLPMFEDIGVFQRLGDSTDVVSKEMYDFEDKGGRRIALRPEQTAGVCRAFTESRPPTPWKVWYAGPNFRYEKPQQGRYRQFDQVGIEVLGVDDPFLDAEVIALASEFYQRLELKQVFLRLNTLGDKVDREKYTAALRTYFGSCADVLSPQSLATLITNPLRVLDSKRPQDQQPIASAPQSSDFLSVSAGRHFETVLTALQNLGVDFTLDSRLVRGLDYYQRTTFEFSSTALTSAQTALGGGGRYDGLVESLGGPPTPGIGFALGLDRTLLACDAEGVFNAPTTGVSVFVVDTTGGAQASLICQELRSNGVSADRAFDNRSMKSQMKVADRSNAPVAVIVGPEELANSTAAIRSMVNGVQRVVPRSDLVAQVRKDI